MNDPQIFDNVQVHIQVDGENLNEYASPAEDECDSLTRRIRYLDVSNPANFSIFIKPMKTFDFRGLKALMFGVYVDGMRVFQSCIYKTDDHVTCSSYKFYDCSSNQWKEADFCFQNLTVVESNVDSLIPEQVKELGKIVVILQRMNVARDWKAGEPSHFPCRQAVQKIGEKQKITNEFPDSVSGFSNKRSSTEVFVRRGIKILGEFKVTFEFRYRSKWVLRHLVGCISRSPTPDNDCVFLRSETVPFEQESCEIATESTESVGAEIAALRARLEKLEKAHGRAAAAVKYEDPPVKGERTKNLDNRRVRARQTQSNDIIDLT